MAVSIIDGPTIATGESLSGALDCSELAPARITMPLDWTPANLTFQISPDGETFRDLFDTLGHEVMIDVTPGAVVRLSAEWSSAPAHLKFRSGTRDNPVVQQGERTFGCVLASGGAAMPTPPAEGSVKHICYVEHTSDIALVTTDGPILTTDTVALDNSRKHAVHFFCPGITFATSNVRAIISIEDNGVILGFANVAATDTPVVLWCEFTPQDSPNHVIRVVARKTGSAEGIVRSGAGGVEMLPSFIEVLQY